MDEHLISTSLLMSDRPSACGSMIRSLPGTTSARALMAVNWVASSETASSTMWILSPVAALTFWIISGSLYCRSVCQPPYYTRLRAEDWDAHVKNDVRAIALEELVIPRRSDRGDFIP